MVKPGLKPPGEHNKVESKKLHKLGRFPKLRAAGRTARKAFSYTPTANNIALHHRVTKGLCHKKHIHINIW